MNRCLSSPLYPSLESNSSNILFLKFKSSNQVQRCMNWKGIVISSIPSQGDIILCGLCQYLSYFYQLLKFFLNSSCFSFLSKPEYPVLQIELSGFGHQICPAPTPDSSKFFQTCLVIYPDMSSLSAKNSSWIKIFLLGLSHLSTLI
jgi:hypothetical protein